MLALHAETLNSLGRQEEAIAGYAQALALDPSFASVHASRGALLFAAGRSREASSHFERSIALGFESAMVHSMYADLLADAQQAARAVTLYRRALRLEPGFVTAANNLSWLLATSSDAGLRDPTEAIRIAEALNREPNQPDAALSGPGTARPGC